MQLQELDYQLEALNSVIEVFKDVPLKRETSTANPTFNFKDSLTRETILKNISAVQQKNELDSTMVSASSVIRNTQGEEPLNIDIKMETGTGKTYVYSRLMLELNREYGFNKFIIITPTVPIKEGTKAFLQSEDFTEHMKLYDEFSNIGLNLSVLDSQKQNNKGRRYPPRSVNEFCDGDAFAKDSVFCFLTGMSMLRTGKHSTLFRNDYDQTMLDGTTRPADALAKTRPIVIIDEPHKFDRSNQSWGFIQEHLNPLVTIRFGATFPANNDKTKDYENLLYNLTSIEAFNRDLIKGVSVYYPEFENRNKTRFTLVGVTSTRPKKVRFRNEQTKMELEIGVGENLSRLDDSFENLYIQDIGKQEELNNGVGIRLDNDKVLAIRDALIAGVFTTSYQELMVNQAIDLHLQKEQENFISKSPKYKSLTLFFIDSPESYRLKDGSDGKLREYFQEALAQKIKKLISKYKNKEILREIEKEYLEFLEASLLNIRGTNGGYFSQDNSINEEDVKKEVDEILRDKQSLLSFKNEDSSWNVRRFIFSKWTLREGWDNPNIFTIAKLRSSGSENSKIQEVGRGLRLPVNEFGVRASAGEDSFYLNYLVDHTESEFADNLYNEINEGVPNFINVKGLLNKVAEMLGLKTAKLAGVLMANEYIDEDYNIIEENRNNFYEAYPDFKVGLKAEKITKGKPEDIRIRKENFEKVKSLWNDVNQNYMIDFQHVPDEILCEGIKASLSLNLFGEEKSSFNKKTISSDGDSITLIEEYEGEFTVFQTKITYGEFLRKLNNRTCLPVSLLHQEIVRFHQETSQEIHPTNRSVQLFVSNFESWFISEFSSRYSYRKLSGTKGQTALTNEDGTPKDAITQSDLGVFKSNKALPEQYLYNSFVYDSPIEEENIKYSNIDRVEVFGKIPRRSIRVPMYFGGTTSPDFMYVLTDESGNQSMNLIIESKGVNNEAELREIEDLKIEASKKFFNTLKTDGVNVSYERQLKEDKILDVLSNFYNMENSEKND